MIHVGQSTLHENFKLLHWGNKYFLFFLEIARDCRKTTTWVTYGNVQMETRMRMRRKKYVVQIKSTARVALSAESELLPI